METLGYGSLSVEVFGLEKSRITGLHGQLYHLWMIMADQSFIRAITESDSDARKIPAQNSLEHFSTLKSVLFLCLYEAFCYPYSRLPAHLQLSMNNTMCTPTQQPRRSFVWHSPIHHDDVGHSINVFLS